jgi:hypothetical protein
MEAIAQSLIASSEIEFIKTLHKTADEVNTEFNLVDLTPEENVSWTNTYIDTYNNTLDAGEGISAASYKAEKKADEHLNSNRIKLALRDKDTLVPFVDEDPDYSIAGQTEFSEKRFDVPYEETDGGILDEKERNYLTMFKGSSVVNEDGKYVVKSESGKVLGEHKTKTKTDAEKQLQAIEINKHKKGSIEKIADYFLTHSGEVALDMMNKGQKLEGFDSASLQAILSFVAVNPQITKQDLSLLTSLEGPTPYQLVMALEQAVQRGYVREPDPNIPDMLNTELQASRNSLQKAGEATGIDLDADEVGQNPINYSRIKQMVEDLLRAGNIPPTKVDLHALKDGKYSLEELRDLVDSFKVKEDTFYPTAHASFDKNEIIKLAEEKLGDMFKEMPFVKVDDKKKEAPKENPIEGKKELSLKDLKPETNKDGKFDPEQLAKGIKIEMEHTTDEKIAERIAKDHLSEISDYYTRLEKMESDAKNEVKKEGGF